MTCHSTRFRYSTYFAAWIILVTVFSGTQAVAQQPDLISIVADGRPWTLKQADGKTGRAVLRADGTADMQIADQSVSPKWRKSNSGQLCVKPAFLMPERCSTLQREGTTIIGLSNGVEQFRLMRP